MDYCAMTACNPKSRRMRANKHRWVGRQDRFHRQKQADKRGQALGTVARHVIIRNHGDFVYARLRLCQAQVVWLGCACHRGSARVTTIPPSQSHRASS